MKRGYSYLLMISIYCSACTRLVEVEPARESNPIAAQYLAHAYARLGKVQENFLTIQLAAYSDDLQMLAEHQSWLDYARGRVNVNNMYNRNAWKGLYEIIYLSDSWLTGIAHQPASEEEKVRITGEFYFLRAYAYYILWLCYGPVPIIIANNPEQAGRIPRALEADLRKHIRMDLVQAAQLLTWQPNPNNNFQISKAGSLFLLSRLELLEKNWTAVISLTDSIVNSGIYKLAETQEVFSKLSSETIWQLESPDGRTQEARVYLPLHGGLPNFQLATELLQEFSEEDRRLKNWTVNLGSSIVPYKYKLNQYSADGKLENSIQFRLAELVLMNAEANWMLGNNAEAWLQLNKVRQRAGVPVGRRQEELDFMKELAKERRLEFFTEQAIRLFDLKRWGLIVKVLSEKKADWEKGSDLLPIPASEIELNPALKQNPGYD